MEHHVHHFWGLSPYINLLEVVQRTEGAELDGCGPITTLQVCPYDCRHTLATLAAAAAAAGPDSSSGRPPAASALAEPGAAPPAAASSAAAAPPAQPLVMYVYEEEPELLARHMMLTYALLSGALPPRERVEAFLELHGGALLRARTAAWLAEASRVLEEAVAIASDQGAAASSRGGPSAAAAPPANADDARTRDAGPAAGAAGAAGAGGAKGDEARRGDAARLAALFDLSLLRFDQRDRLAEAFRRYRQKGTFDMRRAWDARLRRWHGDRYDVRRNMVDWDYHMRLAPRGTPGLDPALGSIIHFYHFRHWRETGVAHELRDCAYDAPNASLLTAARGRTKEFKDRNGRDMGRSVEAFGYWGDVLNGPYHAWGTAAHLAPDEGLFRRCNQQFSHSAMDVAEHNVAAILHQLRTGAPYTPKAAAAAQRSTGGAVVVGGSHRARAARGPTSEEMLAEAQQAGASAGGASVGVGGPRGGGAPAAGAAGAVAEDEDTAAGAAGGAAAAGERARAELAELAAREADLDAAAWRRVLSLARVRLACGDLPRLSSRRALGGAGRARAATLGHMHVHLAGEGRGLAQLLAPGAPLVVEGAGNMVLLTDANVAAFEARAVEAARGGGLERAPAALDTLLRSGGGGAAAAAPAVGPVPPGHFILARPPAC